MLRILLICTGNTCRSPMAEALLNHKLKIHGCKQVMALSAGVNAAADSSASPLAIAVMQDRGIDLSRHRSRQLQPEYIAAADLILVMTSGHRQLLRRLYPAAVAKIYTLGEFCGQSEDISDPYGGTENDYEQCAEQLQTLLTLAWEKLVARAGEPPAMENEQ